MRTAFSVAWESNPSTAAWPRARPSPHASRVPNTKPARNAIALVRGRRLRMATKIAERTSGLAAAGKSVEQDLGAGEYHAVWMLERRSRLAPATDRARRGRQPEGL